MIRLIWRTFTLLFVRPLGKKNAFMCFYENIKICIYIHILLFYSQITFVHSPSIFGLTFSLARNHSMAVVSKKPAGWKNEGSSLYQQKTVFQWPPTIFGLCSSIKIEDASIKESLESLKHSQNMFMPSIPQTKQNSCQTCCLRMVHLGIRHVDFSLCMSSKLACRNNTN